MPYKHGKATALIRDAVGAGRWPSLHHDGVKQPGSGGLPATVVGAGACYPAPCTTPCTLAHPAPCTLAYPAPCTLAHPAPCTLAHPAPCNLPRAGKPGSTSCTLLMHAVPAALLSILEPRHLRSPRVHSLSREEGVVATIFEGDRLAIHPLAAPREARVEAKHTRSSTANFLTAIFPATVRVAVKVCELRTYLEPAARLGQ
jgi:hypothetical protein